MKKKPFRLDLAALKRFVNATSSLDINKEIEYKGFKGTKSTDI